MILTEYFSYRNMLTFSLFINNIELLFFIFGLLIGTFYGFDGWKGSTKDKTFRNSPRYKNFLVVIGGAFSTLLSLPFKADIVFSSVLLHYIIGFTLALILVVGGWGLGIFIKFLLKKKNDTEFTLPDSFSPVGDYFHYGYAYYQENYKSVLFEMNYDYYYYQNFYLDFLAKFMQLISTQIVTVEAYKSNPNEVFKKTVASRILQAIETIVYEYYEGEEGLKINVNYMKAYSKEEVSKTLLGKLKFADSSKESYNYYLAIEGYARDEGREDFVLPVVKVDNYDCLPGAPESFYRNQTLVIDDTEVLTFPTGIKEETKQEINTYFKNKDFRSFACLNIISATSQKVGILNVEANRKFIFGEENKDKEMMASFLHPFCLLLGSIIQN